MIRNLTRISSHTRPAGVFLLALGLLGCGGGGPDSEAQSEAQESIPEVEVWRLSADPDLEIGVREGEEAYELDRTLASALLADGRIAVLDGGSRQIRFFSREGAFLTSIGGEGEGPGEFRTPTRLRRTLGDSLQVWDARLARLSFFDLQGEYLGSRQVPPAAENPMPLEEWLLGRNWIDSPIPSVARGPIRQAVLSMPPPDSLGPPRFLKVTRQGRIWAASAFPPSDHAQVWTVYNPEGKRMATVDLPARFDLHEVGPRYVLGRYRDEMDVNFIRLYGLEKPVGSPQGPGLGSLANLSGTPEGAGREDESQERSEELQGIMFGAVRATASAQEIHYAKHYTYTRDLQLLFEGVKLRFELPEGVDVAVLAAGAHGWIGTFTYREAQYMCGLAYGSSMPMGWPGGGLVCP